MVIFKKMIWFIYGLSFYRVLQVLKVCIGSRGKAQAPGRDIHYALLKPVKSNHALIL